MSESEKANKEEIDDVVVESEADTSDEPQLEDIEHNHKAKEKQLREKLRACEEEKRTVLEDVQRARADFLNTRRRLQEQAESDVSRATDSFLRSLLPLADSFTMAMSNQDTWNAVDESWRKGMEGVYAQLQNIFKQHGVVAIEAVGAEFDPEKHDAVGSKEGEESDRVLEVIQTGYERNGAILRPAKVIIST